MLASTFESGPVGCKATPKRQNQGCLCSFYRAGSGKQVPSSSDFKTGWLAVCGRSDHEVGVATPNYCDLALPGVHALEIGALTVQPKHYIFKHSRKAR